MNTTTLLAVAGVVGAALVLIGVILEFENRHKARDQKIAASKSPYTSYKKAGGCQLTWGNRILFGVCLLIACCGFGYIAVEYMEKNRVKQDYGSVIADMCNHISGSPSQANLDLIPRPYRVVVMETNRTRDGWHNQLPDEVQAEDKASTDIVVCVLKDRAKTIEACPYTSMSGGGATNYVYRVQQYYDVFLLNPEHGGIITSFQVFGSMPSACPGIESFSGNKSETRSGYPPQYEDFWSMLRQLIM